MKDKRSEYQNTIISIEKQLERNNKWKKLYEGKINKLISNSKLISDSFSKVYVSGDLQKNLQIGKAQNFKDDSQVTIDLKYKGISVGCVSIDLSAKPGENAKLFREKEFGDYDKKKNGYKVKKISSGEQQPVNWLDPEARNWRKQFSTGLNWATRPEAAIESYMNKRINKVLRYVAPVKLHKNVFQMSSPVGGNDLSKEGTTITKTKSGHIDLLARVKVRPAVYDLMIIELKDEYTDKERPELVIKQAIAYATFIHNLLRSEQGLDWYHFFGFNSANLPKTLTLHACVMMPKPGDIEPDLSFSISDSRLTG